MIDKIYIFLILGIYFILAFWYYIINSDGEHQFYFKGDYGKKYRANQLFRFVTLIVFTIINFLPTILNLQTNGLKLLAGLFSLSSLCYFFYEILIKNAKRDKYLVCLQNTSLDIVALESVFEIKENKADYILYGDDKTQLFYQATTENGPALITRKANVIWGIPRLPLRSIFTRIWTGTTRKMPQKPWTVL